MDYLCVNMGYFHIKGIRSAMYEPYKFSSWLFDNRVVSEGKYDYEVAETNKVKEGLIKLATINQPINTYISVIDCNRKPLSI